jgi:hypothetical protein
MRRVWVLVLGAATAAPLAASACSSFSSEGSSEPAPDADPDGGDGATATPPPGPPGPPGSPPPPGSNPGTPPPPPPPPPPPCGVGGRDGGPAFTCGDDVCDALLTEMCCLYVDGGHACATTCPGTLMQQECLSTQECPATGKVHCCAAGTLGGTACHTSCGGAQTVCATDAECPNGQYCAPPAGAKSPWWHCAPCS